MLQVSGGEVKTATTLFGDYVYDTENPPTLQAIAKGLLEIQKGEPQANGPAAAAPATDRQLFDRLSARFGFTFTNDLMDSLGYHLTDEEKLETDWQPPGEAAQRELKGKLRRRLHLLQDVLDGKVQEYAPPPDKPKRQIDAAGAARLALGRPRPRRHAHGPRRGPRPRFARPRPRRPRRPAVRRLRLRAPVERPAAALHAPGERGDAAGAAGLAGPRPGGVGRGDCSPTPAWTRTATSPAPTPRPAPSR